MRKTVALLFVLIAAACATSPSRSDDGAALAMQRFLDALNALDAAAIEAMLAEDVTAFFPTVSATRVDGKEKVAAVFREFVEQSKQIESRKPIVAEDLEVVRFGGIAIATFNVRNPAVTSRRTFVFRRHGGQWVIVHFHASNIRQ